MNDRFTPDEIAVIQRAWASIRPVLAAAAAALTPTRDEFALVPNDVAAAAVIPARRALAACLDGDDQHAAELLEGLDADQLYAIEGAGSGLAIHASRHRKRLAAHVETSGDTCLRRTRNIPHIPHRWTYKDAEYSCPGTFEPEPNAEQDGAEDLAAWYPGHARQQADEQPDPTRPDADQHAGPALYKRIRTVLDPFTAGDPDRLADPVWEEIAPVLVEYRDEAREQRHRAETAERERGTAREALAAAGVVIASLRDQRDEQRQRAARANVQATALLRRAETAERQATEHKARAQRAEADAADWRTTAHGYEQALRAEQAEARAARDRTDDPDAWRP